MSAATAADRVAALRAVRHLLDPPHERTSWGHVAAHGVGFGLACAFLPLRLYVLTRLWVWFVVPLGVPAIGMWHAWGLFIVLAMLRGGYDHRIEDKRSAFDKAGMAVIEPPAMALIWLAAWGVGAIVAGQMVSP